MSEESFLFGQAIVIVTANQHDAEALKSLWAKDNGAIKEVLRFLAVDHKNYSSASTEIGMELLRTQKDCFRVSDPLSRNSGLGVRRTLVEGATLALSQSVAERLGKAPNLPGAAELNRLRGGDAAAEETFFKGLDAAAGSEEPSFSAVAALVREQQVINLNRLISVVDTAFKLRGAVPGLIRQALPYLASHPRRDLFECRAEEKSVPFQRAAIQKLSTAEIQLDGWTHGGFYFGTDGVYPISPSTSAEIAHADDTDADQQLLESVLPDGDRPRYAERYLKLCPDSPAAHAYMVRYNWTKAESEGPTWEKSYRGHPVVLGELADKYEIAKKTDDAIRLWQATVKIALDTDNDPSWRLSGSTWKTLDAFWASVEFL